MNIEANHATLAQHTFQHEPRAARDKCIRSSSTLTRATHCLVGIQTSSTNAMTLHFVCTKFLAGGFTNGGLNFDAKARRGSYTMEDIFLSYIGQVWTHLHLVLRLRKDH